MSFIEAALTLVGTILTFAVGYLGIKQKRDEGTTTANTTLIDQLQEELDRVRLVAARREEAYNEIQDQHWQLRADFEALRRRLVEWTRGIRRLLAQIRTLGEVPEWEPEEDQEKQ